MVSLVDSITNSLTRIQTAKTNIKAAIESKGVSVGTGLIDTYADKIREIEDNFSFISQNGTRAAGLFQGMSTLKKVPDKCVFKQPTSFENMFYGCISLTEAPELDTSKAESFRGMFRKTHKLNAVPNYKSDTVTDFARMFNVGYVINPPELDTTAGVDFFAMFASDGVLGALPEYDLQFGREFSYMFNYCLNLQNTKNIVYDVRQGQTFHYMFNHCENLEVAPTLNTHSGKSFHYMFADCYRLHTIPSIHLGSAIERCYDYNNKHVYPCFEAMFRYCYALENITIEGTIKYDIDFSYSSKLTHTSLMSIINHLGTVSVPRYLGLGATNMAKLTDAEKAIATKKGWTLH